MIKSSKVIQIISSSKVIQIISRYEELSFQCYCLWNTYTCWIFKSFSINRDLKHEEEEGSGLRNSASSLATSFCNCFTSLLSETTCRDIDHHGLRLVILLSNGRPSISKYQTLQYFVTWLYWGCCLWTDIIWENLTKRWKKKRRAHSYSYLWKSRDGVIY